MVTYRRLRDADLTTLGQAADAWITLARQTDPLGETARDRVLNPIRAGAWTGVASDNALHELDRFMNDFDAAAIEAVTLASALRRAAAELTTAQNTVRDIHRRCQGRFFVDDNGTVFPPTLDNAAVHDPDAPGFLARKRQEADELQAIVDRALRDAGEADALLARSLLALRPGDIHAQAVTNPVAAALADARTIAQVPKDRALVPAWWRTLEPDMRALLFAADGEKLIKAGVLDPIAQWESKDPGSGEHGAAGVGIKDRALHLALLNAVIAADGVGSVNAARHLQHYLDNSGDPLDVDVNRILRDVPAYASKVDTIVARNAPAWKAQALEEFTRSGGAPVSIPVETGWRETYLGQNDSQDWYLAIGGCMTNTSGVVTVTADAHGQPQVSIDYQVNIRDRYNWDSKVDLNGDGKPDSKSVEIGGMTIKDKTLGKLHEVGLAQEFDVTGTSGVVHRSLTDPAPPPGSTPVPPGTADREGTRTDADGERVDEHARW